jgi:hypothetical protein
MAQLLNMLAQNDKRRFAATPGFFPNLMMPKKLGKAQPSRQLTPARV